LNFELIFPTLLLGTLVVVSVTNPTASTVFAINGANAPSPNEQALAKACAGTAGKPNQPPFCVNVPPPPVDSDGDGIPDESDQCPFDPNNACTVDSDGDGIPDAMDPCPFDPSNTCPKDSDNDGIPDSSDPCPTDPTNACIL
jgi:OmpA-OmpF porin, OOP family